MPLHVSNNLSRRAVIRSAIAAGISSFMLGCAGSMNQNNSGLLLRPAVAPGADRWALLSDLHVAGDIHRTHGGINMATLAGEAVDGVLSLDTPPSGVIVNGDCAYLTGQAADYERFAGVCVKPIVAAGLPLHMALGNHDHRDRFRTALQQSTGVVSGAAGGHCVSVVEGQHARLFLLDSLDRTNAMSGRIGAPQLEWLDASLSKLNDRPALVVGHHPIAFGPLPGILAGALRDGGELWEVLRRHRNVKAYFYGHTHRWNISQRDGIHLVNLPTTAYLFDGSQPRGWVDAHVHPGGAELRLHRVGNGTRNRPSDVVSLQWV